MLLEAELFRLQKRMADARVAFEKARVSLEELVEKRPDDWGAHGRLGLAYAGLGRSADATRSARRAVELMPISRDTFEGPGVRENLAVVYATVGEHDAAIDELEYLLSIPSFLSVWNLRLHPRWDALRGHPRFERLVELPSA